MSFDYSQIRTHRASGRGTRIGRRIGAGALVLIALAVAQVIKDRTPDYAAWNAPFVRAATIGSTIDARTFDVDVLGVRGAAVLSDDKGKHDTSGVWIIVKARFTAVHNPVTIAYAVVVDGDGRTYQASGRVSQPIVGLRELQPALPVTTEIAFEVPIAVAADLVVEFSSAPDNDVESDALAKVHLPIDRRQAARWAATTQPTTLATSKDAE